MKTEIFTISKITALQAEIDRLEFEKARIEKAIKNRANKLSVLYIAGGLYSAYFIFVLLKTI